jgi:hypothetical protein
MYDNVYTFWYVSYKQQCALHPKINVRNTVGIYMNCSVATGAEAICSRAEVYHRKGKVVCMNCSVVSGAEARCSGIGIDPRE